MHPGCMKKCCCCSTRNPHTILTIFLLSNFLSLFCSLFFMFLFFRYLRYFSCLSLAIKSIMGDKNYFSLFIKLGKKIQFG